MNDNALRLNVRCPFCGSNDDQLPDKLNNGSKYDIGLVTVRCGECGKAYDIVMKEHSDVDYEDEISKKDKMIMVMGGLLFSAVISIPFIGKYFVKNDNELKEVKIRELMPKDEN